MTPERWERIQVLYHAARALRESDRARFLADSCAGDAALEHDVQKLLDQPVSTGSFMNFVGRAPAELLGVAATDLTGRQLGGYRVMALLGRGGMGEVYRAHDARLGRSVALKVLPTKFTADAERLARFESEARMLASLNHPHIGAIFGLEDAAGIPALVLEFVDGETLAERLRRGPIALHDALRIADQIADALDAAHRKGIIHRDLKPANVKVTPDGVVKVLDFGLAKAAGSAAAPPQEDLSQSPTMALDVTRVGTILGTAPYMSPEQARGLPVDTRTDIWAFGCVLYEMLTGEPAFQGETLAETVTAILEREPDWKRLPSSTPSRIRELLRRCLQRDLIRRVQKIADARATIDLTRRGWNRWRVAAIAAAAAAVLALSVAAYLALRPESSVTESPAELTQLRAVALTTLPGQELYPSFSSDGKQVAFSWNGAKQDNFDIYVQMIGAGAPLRLTRDPARDYNPVWSPDNRWIAFLRGDAQSLQSELRLIPPLGGPERKLATITVGEIITLPVLLSWCPDSTCLVLSDSTGDGKPVALFALSLETREKRQLTRPEPPALGDSQPAVSPDGHSLVFRRNISGGLTGELYVLALTQNLTPVGQPTRLALPALDANHPMWTPDSKDIVFSAGERLWRVAISGQQQPRRLPFVGEDGIMPAISPGNGGSAAKLAYVRSFADTNIWRIDTSEVGVPSPSPPLIAIASTRQDGNPQFSPDGNRVAFVSNRSGGTEIWIADSDGSNAFQLTTMGAAATGTPRWSPDGQLITFNSNLEGHWDIYVVSASGGRPRRLTDHYANDASPSFSRDGRWVYFNSNRTGEFQIWKVPSAGGEAAQLTRNRGYIAFESPDAAYIYYTQTLAGPSALWRMPVAGGQPAKVLDGVIWRNFVVLDRGIYYIDVGPGGSRLQFFDLGAAEVKTVATGLGEVRYGLTASADGRTILYTRVDSTIDDLMLVENYR
jgi:Tol biopolymer transport system component